MNRTLKLSLQIILTLGLIYFLWTRGDWSFYPFEFPDGFWFIVPVILLLTALNWLLESEKWRQSNLNIVPINRRRSLSETLQAHSIAIVSPLKLGEYPVKLSFYAKSQRTILAKNIFYNNLFQAYATVLFGSLAALFFYRTLFPVDPLWFLIALPVSIFLLHKLWKLPQFWKLSLGLSLGRYLIFSSAMALLIYVFQPETSLFEIYLGIALSYFILTVLPALSIFDWIAKTAAFVYIFSFIGVPKEVISICVGLMWVLNWALPAVLGALLFYRK